MSATFQFLDTDGTTVITSLSRGNLESPSTDTAKKLFVKNNGDQDSTSTEVTIVQVGTNDGDDYAYVANDSGGSPGAFQQTPISLGTIVAGAQVAFWIRETIPAGRTADLNPRRYDLRATGLTV